MVVAKNNSPQTSQRYRPPASRPAGADDTESVAESVVLGTVGDPVGYELLLVIGQRRARELGGPRLQQGGRVRGHPSPTGGHGLRHLPVQEAVVGIAGDDPC